MQAVLFSLLATILGTEMDNIIKGTETMDVGLARAQAGLKDLMAQ